MPTSKSVATPAPNPSLDTCPVARTVDVIGDRWSLLIVRDAFDGVRRFGDFLRSLGVARSMLATRLRALVDAGILAVQPASDGTSYQEYVLTPQGRELFTLIVALRQWGEKHRFGRREPHSTLVDTRTGEPLADLWPTTADGQPVAPEDTQVIRPT
ncbi:helix-turn-helix transcriptional regulator [Pandoraea nosoerga]|uniref:HxlR family transcriptional regulator n=1 Tax=Pandoraea nosoerga TaxID=2508296 RepID=A0A5E4TAI2_9BURK|nr:MULTISPECIES: helix-turn-helix domain-containing protein [Pandoraea]MBN4664266.1 helix-turn-helix transcriptional regulator [Pandoraea nosoerga]MBN4675839.1 helix-turn-helix transcriptional regulator [Pandoraea nosoerga]MBN4679354.1 helix-turn-helix transcriptional regulator [Pandoraea nosoerga]MBN4743649.1 helix-turn-helix transcriptional regulator [Pandoraea nosoerga]VVD83089.1 HxlR family transcriptional regulator [Pandoraea nosoerga]